VQNDKKDEQKFDEEFSRHLDYAEYFPNKKSDVKKEKESHKNERKKI
jgi:hypothetical protein